VDQAAPEDQAILWHLGERREDADLDRRVGLRAGRHRQAAAPTRCVALHIAAGPFGHNIRKDADPHRAFVRGHEIR
jgi:hypothetical protein